VLFINVKQMETLVRQWN